MKLKEFEIRNFRSISHLKVRPKQLSTFIGKNSCGKSNILRSLEFFFTATSRSVVDDDICKFADDGGTWVECCFDGLSDQERVDLGKYVRNDGSIKVRRILRREGEKCTTELHGYVQRPTAAWLQEDYPDYADMPKWAELNINVTQYAQLGRGGKLTKDGFKEFREGYLAANAANVEFVEELSETEFKGRQSTAASLLPHFIFVPAVGDIVSVIYGKQSSLLNEIVAAIVESGKAHEDYAAAQESLLAAQNFVNPSATRLPKLTAVENDLSARLRSWPGTRVTIRTEIDDLAKVLLGGLILTVDDGHNTDLTEKGDGIQRQIMFRVFQLYADFRAQRGIFAPEAGEPVAERGPSIIAFEEPELFLHPQAQEQFYDDLLAISDRDQVLLATHSSHLVRLEQAEGLHIVRRSSLADPTTVKTADAAWVNADDRQRFKEINLCSGEISKIFFADRVVVTEGQEDVIYIAGTARDHANCLDRRVTVVEVAGNQNIPALQRVMNAFGIPYIVACDKDPGNPATAATIENITRLITEANQTHGNIASIQVFDPTLPQVCHGGPHPGGQKYKTTDALALMRAGAPTAIFVERVREMFAMA